MKLFTQVSCPPPGISISLEDKTMVLGSCFADSVGAKMSAAGFDVCVNPFGTLYNPASVRLAVSRLCSGARFTEEDCVPMGAGSDLICSFSHHTSFARPDAGAFLDNANAALERACGFWKEAGKVVLTFGTAFVWKHRDAGIVANCLKRPASEFTREMLDVDGCAAFIADACAAQGKEFILTVSPIRHLGQGAHENTLSKATLQLAVQRCLGPGIGYFPSYEILLDELRDYRWYAENDLVHPSAGAVDIIWSRFREAVVPPSEWDTLAANEKAARHMAHRSLH